MGFSLSKTGHDLCNYVNLGISLISDTSSWMFGRITSVISCELFVKASAGVYIFILEGIVFSFNFGNKD